MNDLQIFNYHDKPIRTIENDGEIWWVLKDVCEVLGIVKHTNVAARLDDDEKGACLMGTPSGEQSMIIVNEPGVYKVILRSDKPDAKDMMRWITHEVLPSIRRTGSYSLRPEKPRDLPGGMSYSGLARLIAVTRRVMLDMGSTPIEIGAMTKSLYDNSGIPVPVAFTKQIPGQLCMYDLPALEGAAS